MELAQYLLKCMQDEIKVDFHKIENKSVFILRLTMETGKAAIVRERSISFTNLGLACQPESIIGRELRRCYEELKDKVINS